MSKIQIVELDNEKTTQQDTLNPAIINLNQKGFCSWAIVV